MKRILTTLYLALQTLVVFGQESNVPPFITLPYQHDGFFTNADPSFPFRANQLKNILVLEDAEETTTIDFIHENTPSLSWKKAQKVKPQKDKTYWLKTTIQGSENFNGEVLLHISQQMGNDLYGFGIVDAYFSDGNNGFIHQQTGDKIHTSERPYNFWAPFIRVNLKASDSLDLYIRMAKMDSFYPLAEIKLWHVDAASIFPRQLEEANMKILFYGVLAIQFLFFLCLFFIERAKIHLHFSFLILGLFLVFAFTASNYHSYVPFPNWKHYHFFFFFLGFFITKVSFLNFVVTYFNFSSDSIWVKKIIPGIIIISAFVDTFTLIKITIGSFLPNLELFIFSVIFGTSVFIVFFTMAFRAKSQNKILKQLFFVAFLPVCVTGLILMNWDFIYILLDDLLTRESIEYRIFFRNISMLLITFMLGVLALSIGYRTRILKQEKEKVLQQNLKDRQTILEKELEANKLQEVNNLKNQFFTNITHEFRTPLTVIMGVNQELANRANDLTIPKVRKEKIAQGHELIERNSNNLLLLINQLLDLSKSDSNNLSVNYQQADIIPYLNYLTESFYSMAKEKNIRLVFYTELKSLVMDFDESKIQQLIYNLLSNALKFTNRGDKIILHAQKQIEDNQANLSIKVSDSGIGIPATELPKIFQRFYQVDSEQKNTAGTGIGLALTKELVELMRGTIHAESEVGVGTVINILLPISTSAPKSNSKWQHTSQSVAIEKHRLEIKQEESLPVQDNKPLLLLVEDNNDIIIYVQQLLENKYQIQTANNGAIGIEKAMALIPDIIISDVMMPEKNGFELTETLKNDPRTSHIPIILLTAKATVADKVEGLKYGADAYLMKPFNKEELMIRLQKLTHLRKELQKRYSNTQQTAVPTIVNPVLNLTMEDLFIEKLQNFIQHNLSDTDLNAAKLGKVVQLGASQLSRKLKALTGETPSLFVRKIRLQKGMELLKSSDLNISEIAYEVGFNDPNYFSRAFHKVYGKSPKIFRK